MLLTGQMWEISLAPQAPMDRRVLKVSKALPARLAPVVCKALLALPAPMDRKDRWDHKAP